MEAKKIPLPQLGARPHGATMRGRKPVDPAKARMGRLRVCTGCVSPTDAVFGPVRGELPCDRCGAAQCSGAIVDPNATPSLLVGRGVRPLTEVPPEPPSRPKPALVDLSTVPKALKPPGYTAPEQHVPRVDVAVDETDDVEGLGEVPAPVTDVRVTNWTERVATWWREMVAAGEQLTRREFARKHGITQVAVEVQLHKARELGILNPDEGQLPVRLPREKSVLPSVADALRAEIGHHEARARLLRDMLARYEEATP